MKGKDLLNIFRVAFVLPVNLLAQPLELSEKWLLHAVFFVKLRYFLPSLSFNYLIECF